MSEETTRWHKAVGNWVVLVPLLTALLVHSCNQSLHLLQGRDAIMVVRGCQMGFDTETVCDFPDIRETPSLCRGWLEVGRTDIWLICVLWLFFQWRLQTSATEHLKVPVCGALCTRVAAKLPNVHLQKKMTEEKMNDGLRRQWVCKHAMKGRKPYDLSGNEDIPVVPSIQREFALLIIIQAAVGAAVCTMGTAQEICTPKTPAQTCQTDVLTGCNGEKLRKRLSYH